PCVRDLPVTGILNLSKRDMELFAKHGRIDKLIWRGVQDAGRYAVAVEPMAMETSSLEANVPANFNLVTLVGDTVGELKFYGQGAGMLPTGNAVVQDVLDCAEGIRRNYDFSSGCAYDPDLLRSDYVLRTTAPVEAGEAYDEGMRLFRGLTAVEAKELLAATTENDPAAIIVALG
ncbi:MAG: homoserine dehydrogenase, partial [Atopobiaceae bacterium]|nr:homoserine dehydrogenase [Atopobiaceae bacterium]